MSGAITERILAFNNKILIHAKSYHISARVWIQFCMYIIYLRECPTRWITYWVSSWNNPFEGLMGMCWKDSGVEKAYLRDCQLAYLQFLSIILDKSRVRVGWGSVQVAKAPSSSKIFCSLVPSHSLAVADVRYRGKRLVQSSTKFIFAEAQNTNFLVLIVQA